eukprot:EC784529.1.p3 GENE.EC784529.1~~EC784529.1.p3  ORF type:complete len:93 (-),score=20.04 EC784529.1:22-300(-)
MIPSENRQRTLTNRQLRIGVQNRGRHGIGRRQIRRRNVVRHRSIAANEGVATNIQSRRRRQRRALHSTNRRQRAALHEASRSDARSIRKAGG